MNDEPLDRLMQDWAARRAAGDAHLQRICRNVLDELDRTVRVTVPSRPADRPGRRGIHWPVAFAAAVVLLAGIVFDWSGTAERRDERQATQAPDYAWLVEEQLHEKALLFEELEALFDWKMLWLAESDRNIDLGLEQRPAAASRPIAVRLVVERRGGDNWTPLCVVDVVAHSEQVVRLSPRLDCPARLALWSYVLPDGLIAVETDLTLREQAPLHLTSTTLHLPRQPVVVYSGVVAGAEIRIFQSAAVLGRAQAAAIPRQTALRSGGGGGDV